MGIQRKDIKLNTIHTERCPKCGMHDLVQTRHVISISLDSIISGILTGMVVLWLGFFMGVERAVTCSGALLASVPFVFVMVKRRSCSQCEIDFHDRENDADPTDFEE